MYSSLQFIENVACRLILFIDMTDRVSLHPLQNGPQRLGFDQDLYPTICPLSGN